MKKLIITSLAIALLAVANDSNAQSFKDKLKAKAAAASKPGGNAGSISKSGTTIHLMEAERGNTKLQLEEGEQNGRKILAINGAMYTWQEEPSATLGKKIYFSTAGLYVMEYDNNSWVSVMPDKELGKFVFEKFMFSNFYSSDAAKVKGMTKAKVEAYATDLSKQILAPSNNGPSEGGNGTYHLAVEAENANKKHASYEISFEEGAIKKIETGFETYIHVPEFSEMIGKDIYSCTRNHLQQYIIVDAPGVLVWAKYRGAGIGKQDWSDNDYFNLFAMDKQVARGLLANESQQKELDNKLKKWSSIIKEAEDKRRAAETEEKIANQRLPKEGMVDEKLKAETLAAAKAWADSWKWKETVTKAYFTGADWYIVRHKLTGVIMRREIRGVIVMSRPDGLCSFHYAVFGQEYDGSKYNKVYTAGITPGQIKLHCEHAK